MSQQTWRLLLCIIYIWILLFVVFFCVVARLILAHVVGSRQKCPNKYVRISNLNGCAFDIVPNAFFIAALARNGSIYTGARPQTTGCLALLKFRIKFVRIACAVRFRAMYIVYTSGSSTMTDHYMPINVKIELNTYRRLRHDSWLTIHFLFFWKPRRILKFDNDVRWKELRVITANRFSSSLLSYQLLTVICTRAISNSSEIKLHRLNRFSCLALQ